MFELLNGYPTNVVAVRAVGRVTADDYRDVLEPALAHAMEGGGKARLLIVLGDDFGGYAASAMLADTEVGIRHLGSFERIAVVTDTDWIGHAVRLFGPLIPGDVRVYPVAQQSAAEGWMRG